MLNHCRERTFFEIAFSRYKDQTLSFQRYLYSAREIHYSLAQIFLSSIFFNKGFCCMEDNGSIYSAFKYIHPSELFQLSSSFQGFMYIIQTAIFPSILCVKQCFLLRYVPLCNLGLCLFHYFLRYLNFSYCKTWFVFYLYGMRRGNSLFERLYFSISSIMSTSFKYSKRLYPCL